MKQLHEFIEQYNFATLISYDPNDEVVVSHIPVILDRTKGQHGSLSWHVAKNNPHAREFDGNKKALFIFHGPHAYISPGWYKSSPSVPTWNYAVVRAYGKPNIITEDQLSNDLSQLVQQHESNSEYHIPAAYKQKLMEHIVGFNMEIIKIESTFKLGQNRCQEDQDGMLAGLLQQNDRLSAELAEFMQFIQERKVHEPT